MIIKNKVIELDFVIPVKLGWDVDEKKKTEGRIMGGEKDEMTMMTTME